MLLVAVDLNIVDANLETCPLPLSLKPSEPLLAYRRLSVVGPFSAGQRTECVHDHIMFRRTKAQSVSAATDYGVSPQRESQLISGRKDWGEPLRFINNEQCVVILRFTRR